MEIVIYFRFKFPFRHLIFYSQQEVFRKHFNREEISTEQTKSTLAATTLRLFRMLALMFFFIFSYIFYYTLTVMSTPTAYLIFLEKNKVKWKIFLIRTLKIALGVCIQLFFRYMFFIIIWYIIFIRYSGRFMYVHVVYPASSVINFCLFKEFLFVFVSIQPSFSLCYFISFLSSFFWRSYGCCAYYV